jgi:hypothetical protein
MLAKSACAVHTLDVAFSRRMCCSRVPSAKRSAGRPEASLDTPTKRPGICRLNASRVAKNAPHGNVGPPLSRRRKKRERQKVRRDDKQSAGVVNLRRKRRKLRHRAIRRRVLDEHAENGGIGLQLGPRNHPHFYAQSLRPGPHKVQVLRMTVRCRYEHVSSRSRGFGAMA